MKTTTLRLKHSMNCFQWPVVLLLMPLAFACFGLAQQAQATCQEGCFTNFNTALGDDALINDTFGSWNTAIGLVALYNDNGGSYNTGTGVAALYSNGFGIENTANGFHALYNDNGSYNTATGADALLNNTTGSSNIALGHEAGSNITTGSHNIDIGNAGVAGDFRTIRIGKQGLQTATHIAAISGVTVPTGVPVIVDTNGHLGTTTSSARFKESIQPMDKASEAILSLKPVTFRYKHNLDPDGIPQFGLVAEQVEKVNPDLVARDEQGKPYTVRYEAVNAMLPNEFLKAHRKLDEQGALISRQQKQIEALTAGLQKVSAELELSKAAPQTVQNSQ
jgi:trimeric autotransporter adhesin